MTIAPRILSTLMVLAVASLAAFSAPGRVTRERFLMGTRCEATVAWAPGSGIGREEAAEAIEAAFDEIARLEAILSDYRPDSELSRLNRQATAAPFACSDDLYGFLARSVELARRSHGAVDITVAPLVQVWDLRGEGRRASAAEIERAREKVGYRLLRMDPTHRSVRFRVAGMGLDPGALGKGFALDAAARILRGRGVTSALLDFGGQILAIGSPPGQEAWQVGVAHPLRRDEQLLALRLRDASVATSGNAERGIMAGGVRLGHVVDPRTGLTVDTDASAVVIAPTATLADAASTAVLVMGPREGLLWAESQPDLSALYLAAGADGAVERRATPGFELAYLPPGADGVAGGAETGGREEEPDRRIADLERRVRELEASLEKTQEASPSAAELQRRIDVLAEELERNRAGQPQKPGGLRSVHGLGPGASKVYQAAPGVSIGGYGETLLQDFDAQRDDGRRSGKTRQADFLRGVFYFGYKYSDRIVFNSEIEFEHATTGEGDEEKGEVSVEFATLDFLLHKAANVRAGLVLLPIGFINELHEPPIFLGARRPDVERNVIPTTWRDLGVGLFGDLGPFSYRAYVVSGLDATGFSAAGGIRGGRQDGSKSRSEDFAFTARADYKGIPGLLLGASYYRGDSGQGAETLAGDAIAGTVKLYDFHGELNFRGLNVRGLWSRVDLDDADELSVLTGETIGSRITGWYGQVGYDVLSFRGNRTQQGLIPFVRYERYDTQDQVAPGFITTGENDVKVITYGFSYKPISNIAIKLDFQDIDRGDGSGTDQINANIGYLF